MTDGPSTSPSLRPKAAATFLGIGESTLWRWAKTVPGFPKPRKLGTRMTVFLRDDLAAWRERHATS
jgi:prophage regulatory protein